MHLQEKIRCSYRTYDHLDEVAAALSVAFNLTGDKIYCGYNNYIRVFDVAIPGRESHQMNLAKKKEEGQKGLISCISFSPDYSGMYALGSYSNTVGVYTESNNSPICLLHDDKDGAGITQVQFSTDGNYLFIGARKSSSIACWDLRKTGMLLYRLPRKAQTNQRINFDIDSTNSYLITGSQDNNILVYDLKKAIETTEPLKIVQEHKDAVNGISIHPSLPLLASSSGQRQFVIADDEMMEDVQFDSRILIWKLNQLVG